MGAGERRERKPAFIAKASQTDRLDVFLMIYKLTPPGPRTAPTPPAAAIDLTPLCICSLMSLILPSALFP